MKYYHATSEEAWKQIKEDTFIKTGCDGVIYLCKDPQEACRFLVLRGIDPIIVLEFEFKVNQIKETFDHSQIFFKCRAYSYSKNISILDIKSIKTYTSKPQE